MFITFEGIDGSGKSTQAASLAQRLQKDGRPVLHTREPGGSKGAEDIRRLLVEGSASRWSPETEILLFTAARRDHLEKIILPALTQGKTVISDRYVDSTRVYQGVARSDLRDQVDRLHQHFIQKEADLTFIIDMDPAMALQRGIERGAQQQSQEDRFETLGVAFQEKLRAGFLALEQEYPYRCHRINGHGSKETIAAEIYAVYQTYQK